MGVGSPDDIVKCVTKGIDMFDSALAYPGSAKRCPLYLVGQA